MTDNRPETKEVENLMHGLLSRSCSLFHQKSYICTYSMAPEPESVKNVSDLYTQYNM